MKERICFLIILCVVFIAGCSGNVPLRGKVTFSDDGSPLTVGTVCLDKEGYMARGVLQSDGTYRMGSMGTNDGLQPGTYRVSIMGAIEDIDPERMISYDLIDSKFTSGDTSGITLTVDRKTRVFDFKVDRNSQPRPKTRRTRR